MTQDYGTRLRRLVEQRGALCAGIDPHPRLLRQWGLDADAAGLERCARTMVEALGETVAVFKPQSAFFEAYGSAGIAALERTLADIAAAGALSLLDVKRGDIGSTMDAYAAAYLTDGSPLAADAVTLSPYLGFGSLDGAIEQADRSGRGVYVLAFTSNPEAPQIQRATVAGRSVAQLMIEEAARRNAGRAYGHVGLVVSATLGENDLDFSGLNASILAPGLGAQGGTVATLRATLGVAAENALPSTSRELMAAGPDADAIRHAAEDTLGIIGPLRAVG